MPLISVITPSIRPEYLNETQRCLERQTFQDFEWHVEIGLTSRGFTLPVDWNKLIKRCTAPIIFILQDCITVPESALAEVAKLDHTKTAYTYPVGKSHGSSIDWDWRHAPNRPAGDALPSANYWEIDLASAPKTLFYDVGGFDEEFCKGWSWENVEIAWRAAAAGYNFKCSLVPEGVAIDHDRITEHPFRNKLPNNDRRANETRQKAERGQFKLSYL